MPVIGNGSLAPASVDHAMPQSTLGFGFDASSVAAMPRVVSPTGAYADRIMDCVRLWSPGFVLEGSYHIGLLRVQSMSLDDSHSSASCLHIACLHAK